MRGNKLIAGKISIPRKIQRLGHCHRSHQNTRIVLNRSNR